MREIIIKNSLRCDECGDVLVSESDGDFKWCSCSSVAIDGGLTWLRRVYKPGARWTDLSVTRMEHEPGDYDPAALEHLRDLRPKRRLDDHIVVDDLRRRPGESDEDFERRKELFEHGGRIAIDVGDLTETELKMLADSEIPEHLRWNSDEEPPEWTERLQEIANEAPHDELEIEGGLMTKGLFGDGTGRLWRLRRHAGETDETYAARVQQFAKVSVRIVEGSPTFEQVGWIEQDRRHLQSEIAQLEADLAYAREQLEKAEKYLDAPGDGEKP